MKSTSFIIALLGLACLLTLGLYRGVDVSTPLVMLATAFISSKSAERAAMVHSSSKDPNADTNKTVEILKD